MLKEYLKRNYTKNGFNYEYKERNMFGESLNISMDFEKQIISFRNKSFKYYSEQHAISILSVIEAEIMKSIANPNTLSNNIKFTEMWMLKNTKYEYSYISCRLTQNKEHIAITFCKKDNDMLGILAEDLDDSFHIKRLLKLPFEFPCESVYVIEVLLYLGYHIQQNPRPFGTENYFDYKLFLHDYATITYKELKKRNIINQMTMDSVEINHNEADKPVLYCSNECRVYNQRANIQMEITNLIKEIKEGKTAVKNIEIFKDCPFFKK